MLRQPFFNSNPFAFLERWAHVVYVFIFQGDVQRTMDILNGRAVQKLLPNQKEINYQL